MKDNPSFREGPLAPLEYQKAPKPRPSLGRIVHVRVHDQVYAGLVNHVYTQDDSTKENQDPITEGLINLVYWDQDGFACVYKYSTYSPDPTKAESGQWFWPPKVL